MATTKFNLTLNIRVGEDFQCFGNFLLGSNRQFAEKILANLKGSKKITNKTILSLELVELKQELPVNIQMLSCTLDELTENCKMITKETFKLCNLEEQ